MRLIKVRTRPTKEFFEPNVPTYAVLLHRWQEEELTFQEYEQGNAASNASYHKIENLCRLTLEDGIEWIWLDTCCID